MESEHGFFETKVLSNIPVNVENKKPANVMSKTNWYKHLYY